MLQILVSCFVKTSHIEEYLCVKVRDNLLYKLNVAVILDDISLQRI